MCLSILGHMLFNMYTCDIFFNDTETNSAHNIENSTKYTSDQFSHPDKCHFLTNKPAISVSCTILEKAISRKKSYGVEIDSKLCFEARLDNIWKKTFKN